MLCIGEGQNSEDFLIWGAEMGLVIEKYYPVTLSVLAGIIYYFLCSRDSSGNSLESLFTTLISISSIMLGFILTSKSILFSIQESGSVKRLKSSDGYRYLVKYIFATINGCLFLAVYSGICLFYNFNSGDALFISILISAISYSVLCFYRSTRIFYKLLSDYN